MVIFVVKCAETHLCTFRQTFRVQLLPGLKTRFLSSRKTGQKWFCLALGIHSIGIPIVVEKMFLDPDDDVALVPVARLFSWGESLITPLGGLMLLYLYFLSHCIPAIYCSCVESFGISRTEYNDCPVQPKQNHNCTFRTLLKSTDLQ